MPGTLYVAQGDTLPAVPQERGFTLICTAEGMPKGWLYSGASVLVVRNTQGAVALFHTVQAIFDRFQRWEVAILEELDNSLRQASIASGCCSREKGESLVFLRDCLLPYFLGQCTREMPLQALEAEGLAALRDYDLRKGSDYWKTLDTYLKTEMSISRTSQALYIHRSSLLKRLEKINRLTGFDLEDPDTRLYLRLYLRLQEENPEATGTFRQKNASPAEAEEALFSLSSPGKCPCRSIYWRAP